MKKRSWTIYLMAFFALVLASCGDEMESLGTGSGNDSRAFTLQLKASDASTEAGEDVYNENHIANVSVFFFKDTETATCAYMKRNIPTNGTNTLKVSLDETFIPDDYYIFVVANTRNHTEDVSKYTLKQMQDRLVYTTFAIENKAQESFIMQGLTGPVRVENGAKGGQITLNRLAAKIVLIPDVEPSIEVDGVKYTAKVDGMDVALHNMVNITHAGGYELTKDEYNKLSPEDKAKMYATTQPRTYKNTAASGGVPAYSHIPFYSYPSTWKAYVDGTGLAESEHQTYLTFRIPWTCEKDGVQLSTNYYYRVPVTNEIDEVNNTRSLKSNTLYKIKMTVGVLGSIDPGQVTPDVDLEYKISEWKSVDISADVNKYNYLELETNYVEMNNESRADIGVTSSSDVTAKVVKITYPDYSGTTIGQSEITEQNKPVAPNRNDDKYWEYGWFGSKHFKEEVWNADVAKYEDELKKWESFFGENATSIQPYGQTLVFQHELASTVYVPWTFTIDVTNKDGQKQELTITQYPPIYITGENNRNGSSNRFVYGSQRTSASDDNGSSLGGAHNPSSASNNNQNQYTIHVTQLDAEDESKYIIGDPRNPSHTQLSALKKYGTPKGLQKYLKTKGESSIEREYDRMIAPVFKIASSWGVTNDISYAQAQKRCASYQENGYPAGRWRIPTEGEIEFIVGLSNAGYIPELFDGEYFASSQRYYHGAVGGTGGFSGTAGSNRGSYAVRCVYDVWYWGDKKIDNPNVFTWGDTEPIRPNN